MVSQMARAKYLGEPFVAYLENIYNLPCYTNILAKRIHLSKSIKIVKKLY